MLRPLHKRKHTERGRKHNKVKNRCVSVWDILQRMPWPFGNKTFGRIADMAILIDFLFG